MRNAIRLIPALLAALVFLGCPAANTEQDAAAVKAAERLVAILTSPNLWKRRWAAAASMSPWRPTAVFALPRK